MFTTKIKVIFPYFFPSFFFPKLLLTIFFSFLKKKLKIMIFSLLEINVTNNDDDMMWNSEISMYFEDLLRQSHYSTKASVRLVPQGQWILFSLPYVQSFWTSEKTFIPKEHNAPSQREFKPKSSLSEWINNNVWSM